MKTKEYALDETSVKIVDRVIAFLSVPANAKYYRQSTFGSFLDWYDTNSEEKRRTAAECGTTCCLAGWMTYARSRTKYIRLAIALSLDDCEEYAADLMRLKDGTHADTNNLFSGSGRDWPDGLGEEYERAATDLGRAKVAIKRLEYFKEHGR